MGAAGHVPRKTAEDRSPRKPRRSLHLFRARRGWRARALRFCRRPFAGEGQFARPGKFDYFAPSWWNRAAKSPRRMAIWAETHWPPMVACQLAHEWPSLRDSPGDRVPPPCGPTSLIAAVDVGPPFRAHHLTLKPEAWARPPCAVAAPRGEVLILCRIAPLAGRRPGPCRIMSPPIDRADAVRHCRARVFGRRCLGAVSPFGSSPVPATSTREYYITTAGAHVDFGLLGAFGFPPVYRGGARRGYRGAIPEGLYIRHYLESGSGQALGGRTWPQLRAR